ncbi:response regulator receiver domain protein, partial [Ichthyophthirius multifiliis]
EIKIGSIDNIKAGSIDNIKIDEEVHLNCIYKKNIFKSVHESLNFSAAINSTLFKKQLKYLKNTRFDIKIVKCKWENEEAVMVLISDISQKVYIERINQIQEYKNQMLSSITHNLKTPLNGIMVMLQSALASNKSKSIQEQLTLGLKNSVGLGLAFLLKPFINLIIDEAYNGQQAIEKVLQNKNYDYIFMDINMPVVDGFQATQRIKELVDQKIIQPTNIIMVSAFNDQYDIEKSFKMGAQEYVSKPIYISNILSAIQRIQKANLKF